jgi:hypothetical protein
MKFQNGRNTALAVDLATLVTVMRAPHSKLKYLEYATNFAHVNSKSTIRVSRAVIVNKKIVFKPWQKYRGRILIHVLSETRVVYAKWSPLIF